MEIFLPFYRHWTAEKLTLVCAKIPVFVSIIVSTVILVLSESKQLKKKLLKLQQSKISAVCHSC